MRRHFRSIRGHASAWLEANGVVYPAALVHPASDVDVATRLLIVNYLGGDATEEACSLLEAFGSILDVTVPDSLRDLRFLCHSVLGELEVAELICMGAMIQHGDRSDRPLMVGEQRTLAYLYSSYVAYRAKGIL